MAKIERRLVPIVSLDVEGYSRLTQLDEAATLSAVHHVFTHRIEATIGDHGGSVFKTMGDSVLAEFTSVVAAVEWAAEVHGRSTAWPLRRRPAHRWDEMISGDTSIGIGQLGSFYPSVFDQSGNTFLVPATPS